MNRKSQLRRIQEVLAQFSCHFFREKCLKSDWQSPPLGCHFYFPILPWPFWLFILALTNGVSTWCTVYTNTWGTVLLVHIHQTFGVPYILALGTLYVAALGAPYIPTLGIPYIPNIWCTIYTSPWYTAYTNTWCTVYTNTWCTVYTSPWYTAPTLGVPYTPILGAFYLPSQIRNKIYVCITLIYHKLSIMIPYFLRFLSLVCDELFSEVSGTIIITFQKGH